MEKGLVKAGMNLPGFVENAYASVEAMTDFSNLLLQSKLCPDHFYEKGSDNKPDYTKGKTAAVMMVLLQGHQLNLPPLTALQHIVPVNGLLSVKGDAAKSMIFGSGKLAKDSWKEQTSGSVSQGDYAVTITAQRQDNGQTLTRTFSVNDAKRAGLWITDEMLRKQDGWKYKKSAWYKFPERMIAYRALGFLARDLFPDVMSGIYTMEEAMDMPQDEAVVIATENGTEIQIPDKNFSQERSQSLTSKATAQIDKRNQVTDVPDDVRKHPLTEEESYPDFKVQPVETDSKGYGEAEEEEKPLSETMLNGTVGSIPVYTEDELAKMSVEDLQSMIDQDGIMQKIQENWDQKNTNKKLRTIILAHYNNESGTMLSEYVKDETLYDYLEQAPDPETEREDADPIADQRMDSADIEPNAGFDESAPDPEPEEMEGNKYGVDVPELVEGKRAFDQVKALYEAIQNVAGIDNKRYETLINTKFPHFQKYRTRDDFCYKAEVSEVNELLNSV